MSATIRVNGVDRPLDIRTVEELLCREALNPAAKGIAVALNDAVVPRRAWAETTLAAGDRVEIVKPFRGG